MAVDLPLLRAIEAAPYALFTPWASTGASLETFPTLAALADRLARIRRGRTFQVEPRGGALVWTDGPRDVVRRAVTITIRAPDGSRVKDLRIVVQAETPDQLRAALARAEPPPSPGRGAHPANRAPRGAGGPLFDAA